MDVIGIFFEILPTIGSDRRGGSIIGWVYLCLMNFDL